MKAGPGPQSDVLGSKQYSADEVKAGTMVINLRKKNRNEQKRCSVICSSAKVVSKCAYTTVVQRTSRQKLENNASRPYQTVTR